MTRFKWYWCCRTVHCRKRAQIQTFQMRITCFDQQKQPFYHIYRHSTTQFHARPHTFICADIKSQLFSNTLERHRLRPVARARFMFMTLSRARARFRSRCAQKWLLLLAFIRVYASGFMLVAGVRLWVGTSKIREWRCDFQELVQESGNWSCRRETVLWCGRYDFRFWVIS